MTTRRRSIATLGVGALLTGALLTGCGSENTEPDTPAASEAPSSEAPAAEEPTEEPAEEPAEEPEADDTTIAVSAVDFGYELEETEYQAGTYTFEFTNDGNASHDLRIERDGEDVAATEVLSSGENTTLEVTLEPGEYILYCSIANHRSRGMEVPVSVK